MQIRDLIKALERFEPTSEVHVEIVGSKTEDAWYGTVQEVEVQQGEPMLICKP